MEKTEDGKPVKVEGRTNGQVVKTQSKPLSRRRHVPRRSWTRWLVSNLARLTMWYTIVTVLFRCPSDVKSLSADTPRVCRHYFTAETYAKPYIQPYYDTYASPYVEKAQPYLSVANERLVAPITAIGVSNYEKYAAPQVAKLTGYLRTEWEKNAVPQLKRAQESAQQAYDQNLAPQVLKVSEVATPYYESARENALNAHEKHIIPAIAYSQPHIHKAYASLYKFILEKGVPFAQHAWTNIIIFLDGTLWPFVKRVYGDNVRPQLVMIGERIAKYQEGRKLQSAMSVVEKSVDHTTTSESTASMEEASSTDLTTYTTSSSTETVVAATPSNPQQSRVATDDTISEDLIKWQKKFAVAADTGTDDLKERIEEIIAGVVKNDFGEGEGLANALQKTCEVQIENTKAKIKSVIAMLPEDSQSADTVGAESEIVKAIQESGSEIKSRARAVRTWHDNYRQELKQRTELATQSTLHVLDDIRDLGLQEIGMRWAWMEGVTYRHWQKYHELKRRFADWRSEVREVAMSLPVLSKASEDAEKLWEDSMVITEDAAKELIRLKDVARWKIAARDSSDDFESRAVPVAAAAASAVSSIASGIKDAIVGSSQGTFESLTSTASDKIVEASSSASQVADDAEQPVESMFSDISSAIHASSSGTLDSMLDGASSASSSAASSASSAAEEVSSGASSVLHGSSTGTVESILSRGSEAASSVVHSVSEGLSSESTSLTDSASSIAVSATIVPSEALGSSASSLVESVSHSASSVVDETETSASLVV